jgi:hypothetical protein
MMESIILKNIAQSFPRWFNITLPQNHGKDDS